MGLCNGVQTGGEVGHLGQGAAECVKTRASSVVSTSTSFRRAAESARVERTFSWAARASPIPEAGFEIGLQRVQGGRPRH